jgi:SAM-dependent methyltransferase
MAKRAPAYQLKYGSWSDYFEKTTVLSEYFYYRRTLLRKVLRYSQERALVLEIGSGTGWSSLALAMARRTVVALDIAPEALRRVGELAANLEVLLSVICADTKALPFRHDTFQIVFSQGVLEHFDNRAIRCITSELLRVAPVMIVDAPTNRAKNQPGAFGDERWLSWKYWKRLLTSADCEVRLVYVGGPSYLGYLLPLALYKLVGVGLSLSAGFVCTRREVQFRFGQLRERFID